MSGNFCLLLNWLRNWGFDLNRFLLSFDNEVPTHLRVHDFGFLGLNLSESEVDLLLVLKIYLLRCFQNVLPSHIVLGHSQNELFRFYGIKGACARNTSYCEGVVSVVDYIRET